MAGSQDLLGGSIVAPAWTVGLLGATVALSGVVYFVWRIRRARQKGSVSQHPTARRG
jgi:hypothetical protein